MEPLVILINFILFFIVVGIISRVLYIHSSENSKENVGATASTSSEDCIDIFNLQKQVDELNAKPKYIKVIDYASTLSSSSYKTYHHFKLEDGVTLTFTSTFCYLKYYNYYAFKEF